MMRVSSLDFRNTCCQGLSTDSFAGTDDLFITALANSSQLTRTQFRVLSKNIALWCVAFST